MSETFRVPGYVVESLIGVGASGDVWRGRVAATGDPVALKRIRLDDPDRLRAAHGEAAVLSALDHPNLMRVHEVVPLRDAVVLVLDLAEGGSLADLVARRGRLSPGEVVAALTPVTAALAHAHAAGVVHGDVSAGNVLFTDVGLPLLADLGVARVFGDDGVAQATPAYVDPVVARGGLPGPWSDVFMAAGVALHALTGAPTWPGASAGEAFDAAAGARLDVAARLAAADVPAELAAVVAAGLVPDPLHRPSAAEFALELRHSAEPVAVVLSAGRAAGRAAERAAGLAVPASTAAPGSGPGPTPAGEPGRPAFVRPGAADPGALPPPSPALTYGARARPVARRPVRPPWWRRRRTWAATAAVLAVTAAVGLLARAVPASHPAAGVASEPAGSSAAVSAAMSSAAAAADPTPSPLPRTGAPAAGPDDVATAALTRLDALRERAFARRDPALLRAVYSAESLRRADSALLARIVPAGCGLIGVRTRYRDVHVVARTGDRLTVAATATLEASRLVCAAGEQARAPGTGPTRLRVQLVTGSDGRTRIAAQTEV